MPPSFTPKQQRFMDFVEQKWYESGSLPSCDLTTQAVAGLSKAEYEKYTKDTRIIEYMREVRGVDLTVGSKGNALSPEQLVTCNTLLNLADTRSERKKLQDLGISPGKWDAWKRDPAVQHYLRSRAENVLGDNMHEAHMGLLDAVRRGDTKAISLYYDITGRFSPRREALDVSVLLNRVLEVLMRNITDTQLLARIANDLLTLDPSTVPSNHAAPAELMAAPQVYEPNAILET